MIEEIATYIAKKQFNKPYAFILAFALISLMLFPGLFLLVGNVEPSIEKVLPSSVREVSLLNDLRTDFGADMIYIIIHTDTDIRDAATISYINLITQKIDTIPEALSISSIADPIKEKFGHIPDSSTQIENFLNTYEYTNMYVNSDYSWSVIRIQTNVGSSASEVNELLQRIELDIESLETLNPSTTYQITGYPAIDRATFNVILSDFALITAISFLFISIVVYFTFKSLIKGLIPMVVVMNALLWTMGITGYLGLQITVVSMVSAAMIMGLGIDFGIHFVHSYFEKRKHANPQKAHKETLKELLRAMTGASLTTTAGFLALLFGVLPAMKVLGIILAIGIMSTLISAILLLPPIILLYDNKILQKVKI